MVDHQEQVREVILNLVTYVAGLKHFNRKMEVMTALYDVEWSLRLAKDKVK